MFYSIKTEKHILDDGNEFHVARHPDLQGCHGFGSTLEDALERLALARQAYLDVLHRMGSQPPQSSVDYGLSEEPAVAMVQGAQENEWAFA